MTKIIHYSTKLFPLEKVHHDDAGYDLRYFDEDGKSITIYQNQILSLYTGISLNLPSGYEAQIRSRSGLALKHGLFVLNSPATIDSGYKGEIRIILSKIKKGSFEIHNGDRIAQLVINRIPDVHLEVSNIKLHRSKNGLGSSGVK